MHPHGPSSVRPQRGGRQPLCHVGLTAGGGGEQANQTTGGQTEGTPFNEGSQRRAYTEAKGACAFRAVSYTALDSVNTG